LVIRSEIGLHKANRGCEVRIAFPAASSHIPLRLLDAQTWCEAMSAIIADTRAVQSRDEDGRRKRWQEESLITG
jgi:hypothetical protein